MGRGALHHMTWKALWSEHRCAEEWTAERPTTHSCGRLTERRLLTLKLLLKLLELLRNDLNDLLKLLKLLRDDLQQLLNVLKQL